MEISEIKERTAQLEQSLLKIIQDYETETEISVSGIDLTRITLAGQIGQKGPPLYRVRVSANLW